MYASPSQSLTHKKFGPNKLVLGFLVAAVTAIISSTGVAGARPAQMGGGAGYGGGNVTINVNGGSSNITIIIIQYFMGR